MTSDSLFFVKRSFQIRYPFRFAATKLGYGNNQADLVYGVVDLSLSAYGAGISFGSQREVLEFIPRLYQRLARGF
ncbi:MULTISPECIES: DUF4225 domain-containing protein [Enterobacter cloacae complex]|uniref:DUF4225 domain-containing protein n=1 Tax=Enterobacter cloacae complex TaxID=354276 RepID=UPI001E4D0D2C|nr:DUF4225 domain-containing protein [Enterobacter hormaechei]MDA4649060.1 DUF4225 domain-containing protein [Enterobacter hormaechei]